MPVCEICCAQVAEGMRACPGLSPCWKALWDRDRRTSPDLEHLVLLRRGSDALRTILSKVEHHPYASAYLSNCAGPGHCHEDGVTWDKDNREGLAGKECKWCRAWRDAAEILKKLDAITTNPEVTP